MHTSGFGFNRYLSSTDLNVKLNCFIPLQKIKILAILKRSEKDNNYGISTYTMHVWVQIKLLKKGVKNTLITYEINTLIELLLGLKFNARRKK